uniref:Uncharacterized protein n=1 Tax=Favella ehrenbergii TaxID=182087 RepID=A0A7S3HXS5_9SPIT
MVALSRRHQTRHVIIFTEGCKARHAMLRNRSVRSHAHDLLHLRYEHSLDVLSRVIRLRCPLNRLFDSDVVNSSAVSEASRRAKSLVLPKRVDRDALTAIMGNERASARS